MSYWQETKDHVNKVMLATFLKGRPLVDPVSVIWNNNLPGCMDKVMRHVAVYGHDESISESVEAVREACKVLDKKGFLNE
ncbi:hypothetical protein Aeh1ORF074c [Aeromonas phage Aeh1]|uniref:Uncharacterized protein n=1 Tax=Aeromonas phage Aeh1 TaxID=2880362 RepID=Q76Z12_9CAUD|nr:hypothetical protein Aeh1p079 [Aeromonas phage Aeh1]AAQ17734.1 hypothetical protein Aeh1ORF074c [Aeromonas phage Aeh1]